MSFRGALVLALTGAALGWVYHQDAAVSAIPAAPAAPAASEEADAIALLLNPGTEPAASHPSAVLERKLQANSATSPQSAEAPAGTDTATLAARGQGESPPHFGYSRDEAEAAVDTSPPSDSPYQTASTVIQPGDPDYDRLMSMMEQDNVPLVVGDMMYVRKTVGGDVFFAEYTLAQAEFIYNNPEIFVDEQLSMFFDDPMMGPWEQNWGMKPPPGFKEVFHYCRQSGCLYRATFENPQEARQYVHQFMKDNPNLWVDPLTWDDNLVLAYWDAAGLLPPDALDEQGTPTISGLPLDANGDPIIPTPPYPPILDENGNPVYPDMPFPPIMLDNNGNPIYPDTVLPPLFLDEQGKPIVPNRPPPLPGSTDSNDDDTMPFPPVMGTQYRQDPPMPFPPVITAD
ncbi:hypothetical protein SAMN04488540_11455 [Ferrimonas sediminum]|uniref:Uncharacterized protein n=1 Tax=Ferrimonas sediminum TaxID=718193 RepID=A0A1G8X1J3_9GAMM|nr:hypothetical protein [Ferrimonas sediminum]SDJ84207.1 hypothetical protein SAMN04488540_11455 [Ferrimonas sediminum]